MIFEQLASGSAANAYLITFENGKQILVECGMQFSKLKEAIRFDFSDLICCLISHDHQDHCRSARQLLQIGIPVYATWETLKAIGIEKERNANSFPMHRTVQIDSFRFVAFPIEHDAADPCGFIIHEDKTNEECLFVTDTAYIRYKFAHKFSIIALEASYDKAVLEYLVEEKQINETLARRLLDTHMEISTMIDYLKKLDLSKCRQLHLLHCSDTNISIQRAIEKIKEEFFIDVLTKNNG